ncbi:hypothetical protein [Rhodoplanes azumiensis]|uniref:Uncharacterized protein n=1 Tax=Rhodoplanes azumiensis TaxID=1897628 RepID=A0ABW5AQ89_9BRAD
MNDRTRGGHRGRDDEGSSNRPSSSGGPSPEGPASVSNDRLPNERVPNDSVPNDSVPNDKAPNDRNPTESGSDARGPETSNTAAADERAAVAKVLSGYKPSSRHARQVAMRVMSAAACTESRVLIDGAAERVSSSDQACETHRVQISKSRDTIAQTRALIRRLDKP